MHTVDVWPQLTTGSPSLLARPDPGLPLPGDTLGHDRHDGVPDRADMERGDLRRVEMRHEAHHIAADARKLRKIFCISRMVNPPASGSATVGASLSVSTFESAATVSVGSESDKNAFEPLSLLRGQSRHQLALRCAYSRVCALEQIFALTCQPGRE